MAMLHVVLQAGDTSIGPVGQTTVVGAIVISLLSLMGWLVKRLLDNLVNQNTTLMTQQLSKMDDVVKAIVSIREEVSSIREELRDGFHDLARSAPTPQPVRREDTRRREGG